MSIASQTVKKGTITRKAVFVSVTNALAGKIPGILPSTPLVDFSRGFWHVNASKIEQCELLVAVEKGIVRGVWEIDVDYKWHPMSATAIPTLNTKQMVIDPQRQYCRVLGEVLHELKGKRLSAVMSGMRMYGPVQYNF